MKDTFNIQAITTSSSDEIWKTYFQVRKKCVAKINDYMAFANWEQLKTRNTNLLNEGGGIYFIKKGKDDIGYFNFFPNSINIPDKRFQLLRIRLINESLNNELLQLIFNEFLAFDPLSMDLAIESSNEIYDFLVKKINPYRICQQVQYELKINEANHEIINTWLETTPSKFNNYKIRFFDYLPDEIIAEFADVFTQLLDDMPANSELGEFNITPAVVKKRQEDGRKHNMCAYRYLVYNEKNQLIGHTNVSINKNNPKVVHQFMTGVLAEYRRQGISKWMKSKMFQKLTLDFPELETIETETHPDNIGSIGMSRQMGFMKTGIEKQFLFKKQRIINYLINTNHD